MDKEYEKEQKENRDERVNKYENGVASVFRVLSWINLILGFIAGIALGGEMVTLEGKFNGTVMFICWAIFADSALVGFAIAEVIQILHDIRAKVYKK